MFTLRDYQADAVNAAMDWMRTSTDPALLALSVGAGKSIIASAIADEVAKRTRKHIIVLQPSNELLVQNRSKYPGESCTYREHDKQVIFTTPQTFRKNWDNPEYNPAIIIIDEAHAFGKFQNDLKRKFPSVRIIGMTGTPYRLGHGLIYGEGKFYKSLLVDVGTDDLIARGFLTGVKILRPTVSFDTSSLKMKMGKFTSDSVADEFEDNRKTPRIMASIVSMRPKGAFIYCTSVRHGDEAMRHLPKGLSAMVTSDTKKSDRADIMEAARIGDIRYLVNVQTLTTGIDLPHFDMCVILRPTESAALIQQMVGRVVRNHPGKKKAYLIDYAENLERHRLDGSNLFRPNVEARPPSDGAEYSMFTCPSCAAENAFAYKAELMGVEHDDHGYMADGETVVHQGVRCYECGHYWNHKECPKCDTQHAPSARECRKCDHLFIDHDDALAVDADHLTPTSISCNSHLSKNGSTCLLVTYTTDAGTAHAYYTPKFPPKWNFATRQLFGRKVDTVEDALSLDITFNGKIRINKEGDVQIIRACNTSKPFELPTH